MEDSNKEKPINKTLNEITTFPIPRESKERTKNITITNIFSIPKEDLIKKIFELHSHGNISQAIKYYKLFINQGFNDPAVFSNYGILLKSLGKFKEAELFTRKAIELIPDYAIAHFNLGNIMIALGNSQEAKISYLKAIELNPNIQEAHLNLGSIFRDLGNLQAAEVSTRKAIELNPESEIAHSNLGTILMDLDNLQAAESSTRKAIELNPNFAQAYSNLGSILVDLGKLREAESYTRKAIELNPDFAEAHSNLGNILRDLGNLKAAEVSTRKAIELNPNFAQAHSNLGLILKDIGNCKVAINHYKKAIKINNKLSVAKSGLIEVQGLICDWSERKIQAKWIDKLGIEGTAINPISLFYYDDNPLKQLKRSKKFYQENFNKKPYQLAKFKNKKIHIGYFSADFNKHATMYLIASILELHDKSKFEIYLYSFTPNEDNYTERAKKSGCFFRDIRKLNTLETVELARKDKLDIAIDLKGYTQYCRMNIFSYRVASIQINYLGYPGTLGSDTIDYILADSIIIPEKYEKFYSEKVLRMPSCYQCNDNTKEFSKIPISRKDFNLPNNGFVFTCFNANKKITAKEFDIWMRLLSKIKGSVLWLIQSNQYSKGNLIYESTKRNIDPDRIIFAKELPLQEHLSRHTLGDLALDTFNYNGHTTTSDALWSGLPVLTKMGESFAARVSSSLLTSIGLPELITYSEKEYEEKALKIASNPNELRKLKSKLTKARDNSPLYNSEQFTRNLENIFKKLMSNR